MSINKKNFNKLSLPNKYNLLKQKGEYIGGRQRGAHRVYLFLLDGIYIEMWQIISLNNIQWIEIQENQSIIEEYVEKISLDNLW